MLKCSKVVFYALLATPLAACGVEVSTNSDTYRPLTGACGPVTAECGDGELDPGEWCDDGNNISGDLCSCDCLSGLDQSGTWEGEDAAGCSPRRIANTTLLQTYLDSLPVSAGATSGTPVKLPPNATIRLCDHDGDGVVLHMRRRLLFDGQGTRLVIPGGASTGSQCQLSANPLIGLRLEGDAATSHLENLVILTTALTPTPATAAPDMVAVDIRTSQVSIEGFSITNAGVAIRIDDPDGGGPINVNHTMVDRTRITTCGIAGIATSGGDSQAGAFTRNYITGCANPCGTAAGLDESSFLGNAYLANATEGNQVGIRLQDLNPANSSLFVGHYIESSDELDVDAPQTRSMLIAGGNLAPTFRARTAMAGESADVVGAAGMSYLRFGGIDEDSNHLQLEIPAIGRHAALQFRFVPGSASPAEAIRWPTWYLGADSWDQSSPTRRGWSFWAEGAPGLSSFPTASLMRPSLSFYVEDFCGGPPDFFDEWSAELGTTAACRP